MTATCTNGIYMASRTSFYNRAKTKKICKLSFFQPTSELSGEYVAWREEGRRVYFKQAQKIAWSRAEDGYVALKFKPLQVYAVGANRHDAIEDFWEALEFIWRNYVCCDESELTQDAIELKHRAQKYLTEG